WMMTCPRCSGQRCAGLASQFAVELPRSSSGRALMRHDGLSFRVRLRLGFTNQHGSPGPQFLEAEQRNPDRRQRDHQPQYTQRLALGETRPDELADAQDRHYKQGWFAADQTDHEDAERGP